MEKDEKALAEKIRLLEQEITTLTAALDGAEKSLSEIKDIRMELRALKLFLERHHPELGRELPEIMKKLGQD